MMVAGNEVMDIPAGCFLHPKTGQILPIEGNVAVDPLTAKIVITADSDTGQLIHRIYSVAHKSAQTHRLDFILFQL